MSDPVVTDEAVETAQEGFGETNSMRHALVCALPHLVAERDAEIARLHGIIREMVRLSPDNPEVEDAALASLEKPHE